MSQPLKVAMVGVGRISRLHMPGWAASEHAEVVAGCDVNQEALDAWGQHHDIDWLVTDAADLFDDPGIDVVDICTPNNYHAPLAIAALDAGKHVLCEKPLAPGPEQVRHMIEARDRSGKLLMTAQHHRFRGISQAMKAEIDAGVLGDIYHARCWALRRAGVPVRPGLIIKQHSSGGPCIDIGVHVLDTALWLMGNPKPIAVCGVSRAALAKQEGAFSTLSKRRSLIPPEFDVEDFAAAFVRFESGASLILEASWMLHHAGDGMQAWLYGTQGGCLWPKGEFYETNYQIQQLYNRALQFTPDAMPPHALECVEFARAVVEGAPSPVPAEQSLQVMLILDGIYRSQERGAEVRFDR